jgi:hypothetical protein
VFSVFSVFSVCMCVCVWNEKYTFRADKKVSEIVTCTWFSRSISCLNNTAIRQHHFQRKDILLQSSRY